MKDVDIMRNISELQVSNGKLKAKYLRNLRLYLYSINVSLDQIREGNLVGYWHLYDGSNNTSKINENVIQSCIDALTSQLASKHSRPFVSTNAGTYGQRQVAHSLQNFFDVFLDEQDINKLVTEAFRDACIFGEGVVFIDTVNKKLVKALPWQVHYRPAEKTYGDLTRIYYERKDYPITLLPEIYRSKVKSDYVTFGEYYDTTSHIKVTTINNKIVNRETYSANVLPFSFIHYSSPIYGKDSSSVPDILYGIQEKLDSLYQTISEAIRLNPAQTFFVPQGSDIKVTSLNNRVGEVVSYKPIEGLSNPITVATPDFIANQYLSMVETLKKDAYELVGISELSAQSKKPGGLDSGRALQTLNDIESERFETQYKSVINMYTDIVKKYIKCSIDEGLILPNDINRLNVTWKQAKEAYDKLKIVFSNMDFLSKDPSTRAQELDILINKGVIPQSRAALYYDIPDLTDGYNYANNAMNAVMSVINEAILHEDYDIPVFVPRTLLKPEILNTMMSLKAVETEENIVYIDRLKRLYDTVCELDNNATQSASQQQLQANEAQWQDQLKKEQEQIINQTVAQAIGQKQAMMINSEPLINNQTNNIGVNNEFIQ